MAPVNATTPPVTPPHRSPTDRARSDTSPGTSRSDDTLPCVYLPRSAEPTTQLALIALLATLLYPILLNPTSPLVPKRLELTSRLAPTLLEPSPPLALTPWLEPSMHPHGWNWPRSNRQGRLLRHGSNQHSASKARTDTALPGTARTDKWHCWDRNGSKARCGSHRHLLNRHRSPPLALARIEPCERAPTRL